MNLSIHLALTLNFLFYGHFHIFLFNVMSLSSLVLFCLYANISKPIQDQNIIRTLPTRQKSLIVSKVVSLFVLYLNFNEIFIQIQKFIFFIHRSSIRHWILDNKTQGALLFILVNGSNDFIDMSVIYQKNYQLFFFKPFRY